MESDVHKQLTEEEKREEANFLAQRSVARHHEGEEVLDGHLKPALRPAEALLAERLLGGRCLLAADELAAVPNLGT
jgi:hypothetical protein